MAALVAAPALGAAAVAWPTAALGATIGLIFAAVALYDLAAGVALFAALAFFERIPGSEGGLSPSRLAAIVLVVAALGRVRAPSLFRDRPVLAAAAIGFAAWALASTVWAADVPQALGASVRIAVGVVLFFVVATAVRELRHVRWIVFAYLSGAAASTLAGLAGGGSSDGAFAGAEAGRLAGGVADPNTLAAFLLPAVALATFGVAAARGLLERWLLMVAAVLFVVAVFLTQSRGGLVGLGVVLVVGVIAAGPLRPYAAAVLVAVATVAIMYYAVVAPPEARGRITAFTAQGGSGRLDLWRIAEDVIRDHPVAGVGAGNFPVVEPVYASRTTNIENVRLVVDEPRVAHNTALEIAAELGMLGFAAFAVVVVGALAGAARAVRSPFGVDTSFDALARGLLVGIAGLLVAFLFVSGQAKEQLWVLLGVAAALPALARWRVARTGRA
jgi:putative inorganic carbon (HCO3(-)) transporter